MRFIAIITILLSVSCAATHISSPKDNLHVIGKKTGKWGTGWYDDKFEDKAAELCGRSNYKVIEKARKPEALKDAGILTNQFHFYWVVECLAKK